jgi:hypothetical protein
MIGICVGILRAAKRGFFFHPNEQKPLAGSVEKIAT